MNGIDKTKGEIKINESILQKAISNNSEALKIMFEQFIPEGEEILYTQYLGRKGLWWIGTHSFACLTNRRIADISVGHFSEVIYQEGCLESINSSVILQPSKLGLYLLFAFWILFSFFIFSVMFPIHSFLSFIMLILLILLTPFLIKSYYGIVKCGIVFWIREGIPVYIFSNRAYLHRANYLCRGVNMCREKRLKELSKFFVF